MAGRLLALKARRDLRAQRAQFAAVTAIVALGTMLYVLSWSSYLNVGSSLALSYERLGMADFTVAMNPAPDTVASRVACLPGVLAVEGRVVMDRRVKRNPLEREAVTGRIISLPNVGQPRVNRLKLMEGSYLRRYARREALLEVGFARYNRYRPGDVLYVESEEGRTRLRIVGLVASPEYIYAVQSKQSLFASPSTFGVLFVSRDEADRLLGMGGAVNELCVLADPARQASAMNSARGICTRYGALDPQPLEEQPSNRLIQMDVHQWRKMAFFFPVLFLSAAMLSLYVLLARIVHMQRTQIGFLRASGYSSGAVLAHYVQFGLVLGVAGGVLGVVSGQAFATYITRLYVEMLNIPYVSAPFRWQSAGIGLFMSLAVSCLACLAPARGAALLAPAEAMRAWTETASVGLRLASGRSLPLILRMPVRNLLRRLRRTAYTMAGVAAGISLVVLFLSISSETRSALDLHFERIVRYDASVALAPAQPESVLSSVEAIPGVRQAEGTLGVPVALRNGASKVDTVLVGIPPGARLLGVVAAAGGPVVMEPGRLLMSDEVCRRLGVRRGDAVWLEYAFNSREVRIRRRLLVGAPLRKPIGSEVYLPLQEVRDLFGAKLELPDKAINSALVACRKDRLGLVKHQMSRMPGALAVESPWEIREQLDEQMAFSYLFTGLFVLFGVVLAGAVIFNTMTINILERAREVATLRALGFSMARVRLMITVENLMVVLLGLVAGLPGGYWLNVRTLQMFSSESFSLEAVTYPSTYVMTAVGALVVALLAQIPGLRQMARMDLAEMTRTMAE